MSELFPWKHLYVDVINHCGHGNQFEEEEAPSQPVVKAD